VREQSRQQTTDNRTPTTSGARLRSRYSFRNLSVWQKSQDLSELIVQVVRDLPADRVTAIIGVQLLRSSTSIAANIAEGHGRFAPAAYRNHLSIARGSANETLTWLDLLRRCSALSEGAEAELSGRCEEIVRMISAQMIELARTSRASNTSRASSGGR